MAKLSEQLRLLTDRAAAIEQRAEAARKEAAEKRDAKVAEARARLEEQQEAFTEQVTAVSEDTKAAWLGLKDSLKSARDKVRSDVDKGVRTLESKDAEVAADIAEEYAERRSRVLTARSGRGRRCRDGIRRGKGPGERARGRLKPGRPDPALTVHWHRERRSGSTMTAGVGQDPARRYEL